MNRLKRLRTQILDATRSITDFDELLTEFEDEVSSLNYDVGFDEGYEKGFSEGASDDDDSDGVEEDSQADGDVE